ncbi:MAG: hypothetical protein WBF58_04720 [Xanthobacteraceae bacterium]
MTKFRRRKRTRRGRSRYLYALTPERQAAQRQAAFMAIRQLYCESLPLWRSCARGHCRRHRCCSGDGPACLKRGWPLTPPQVQAQACELVSRGGPRRIPSATHVEWVLRTYPPSNFVP